MPPFRKLLPTPPDGDWRAKLIRSGRKPETLAEVYLDKDGAPLIEGLIALARVARDNGLLIKWGGSPLIAAIATLAYGAIRRFSEDIDLTYDIRAIAADLVAKAPEASTTERRSSPTTSAASPPCSACTSPTSVWSSTG